MEATRITTDELAANLTDIMKRVIVHHEHFLVVKGDTVVAELRPGPKPFTVADFRREFGDELVPKGLSQSIIEGGNVTWTGKDTAWFLDADEE